MKKTQKMEDLTAGIILDEYESLYRMAYTYVHNESDAMDSVQELSLIHISEPTRRS
mgnify:CR=1 FL=1